MKNFKHGVMVIVLLAITVFISRFNVETYVLKVFIVFSVLLASFNLIFRKSLVFKNYFTSKYNVLTSKFHSEKTYDISEDLMFQKVIEIINDSKFKVAKIDKMKLEILATSPISFTSWGETLYISFDENSNGSTMKFCSVSLFGMYSWGRNETNYNGMLRLVEDSLTV